MKVNFLSEYKNFTGRENMEIDLAMLNQAILEQKDELYLRFYGWKPRCVSLGRNQKEFTPNEEIDVVRRPTGGRALLHDMEITYCVVGKIQEKQSVIETYKMLSTALIKGFESLDIKLEFAGERGGNKNYCMNISSGADICYQGRKFIGSAQFRKEGFFLQHGSILKDADYDFLEKIFKEPVDKNKIVTLKEINPNIQDETVICAIKEAFKKI